MTMSQQIPERARAERLELIRRDLVRRIRPLCHDMPDDIFMELVDSMATVQLKYETRENPPVSVSL